MLARVLFVEDGGRARAELRDAMAGEGYRIAAAAAGADALDQLRANGAPDVVLVDLVLGDMDGFSCIREIRRDHDVPIMVVTDRDDTHDVVAALEAGADDFVSEPFEVKEVTARVRALRRRAERAMPREADRERLVLDAHPAAPLELAQDRGTVRRGTKDLQLTLTEYRLLCELAGNAGRVVSRPALLESVWGGEYFGDERIVDVHVRRLRKKIERDPSEPRIVVTVRGLGYRLDPPD
ncbi:response regulator transcription factor [Nocardia arthritidis]|uniref:Response regulator n=1 Tax=Nocardia arthritidis TaxID=228602 RepID=A0A6G9YHC4_9NOCA|nr:response regulator transcription factor [Nocardia arthritidis]QIS12598.1 response regulator [Nocardia arthritidis]